MVTLSDVVCRLRSVAAVEKAEAQKIQVVKAAEADAEAKFLQGQGIARQRQAIVNGLRESVLDFNSDVSGAHYASVRILQLCPLTASRARMCMIITGKILNMAVQFADIASAQSQTCRCNGSPQYELYTSLLRLPCRCTFC